MRHSLQNIYRHRSHRRHRYFVSFSSRSLLASDALPPPAAVRRRALVMMILNILPVVLTSHRWDSVHCPTLGCKRDVARSPHSRSLAYRPVSLSRSTTSRRASSPPFCLRTSQRKSIGIWCMAIESLDLWSIHDESVCLARDSFSAALVCIFRAMFGIVCGSSWLKTEQIWM